MKKNRVRVTTKIANGIVHSRADIKRINNIPTTSQEVIYNIGQLRKNYTEDIGGFINLHANTVLSQTQFNIQYYDIEAGKYRDGSHMLDLKTLTEALNLSDAELIYEHKPVVIQDCKTGTYDLSDLPLRAYKLDDNRYITLYTVFNNNVHGCIAVAAYHLPNDEEFTDLLATAAKRVKILKLVNTSPVKAVLKILIQNSMGYSLRELKLKDKPLDIKMNYNDDFNDAHNAIVEAINDPERSGLILLHGEPGTGKTNYIRNISKFFTENTKRSLIFVPTNYISSLADPAFIAFLAEHMNNSIVVLEDCETALTKREDVMGTNSNSVSNLLNLTDGLLGDGINILFVATFNSNIEAIDPALMRKGRLVAKYAFAPLSANKAEILHEVIHKSKKAYTEPTSLANIYHVEDLSFEQTKRETIGFK